MSAYLYLKALHLISMVVWFAGMFYLGRLFVYHAESFEKLDPERRILHETFKTLERRLSLAIIEPGMALTLTFGVWLMVLIKAWTLPWFHLKLAFLVLLFAYHGMSSRLRRRLAQGHSPFTSVQLRIWNEIPTLLLFAIVFSAVLKSLPLIAKALAWLAALSIIIGLLMHRAYKRKGMLGKSAPSYPEAREEKAS